MKSRRQVKPMSVELKSVAYHEAGHAAVAIRLGIGIGRKGVTIIPDKHTLGWAQIRKGFSGNPDYETSGRMRLKIENRVLVLLAGLHASQSGEGCEDDLRRAWNLLEYFCGSHEEVQAYLDWLNIRAKQLVESEVCKVKIEAIAQALLEKKKLSAGEVKAIAQAAVERWIAGNVRAGVASGTRTQGLGSLYAYSDF